MKTLAAFACIAGCACAAVAGQGEEVITGSGNWRYKFRPNKLALGQPIQNGHGLALPGTEASGVYFTWTTAQVTDETSALARFAVDGSGAPKLLGGSKIAVGTPHGLRYERDGEEEYLYHANNDHLVLKTTTDGELVWSANLSSWEKEHPEYWPIKPTQTAVAGDILLVADGYGRSFVHHFDKRTGEYLNFTFGGLGNSTDPLRFNIPHGISQDPRFPGLFAVSDRVNSRIVWVDAHGKFVKEMSTKKQPGGSLPCNHDVFDDRARTGASVSVIPSLGDQSGSAFKDGSAAIFKDGDEHPLSVLEIEKLIGHLGHQHPHDAIFLPNGDLVVCCWSGPSDGPDFGPALGTISYWERL